MDKSLERLAEELHINVYDAVQIFDLGRGQQHDADVEFLGSRLVKGEVTLVLAMYHWLAFKEMKLE